MNEKLKNKWIPFRVWKNSQSTVNWDILEVGYIDSDNKDLDLKTGKLNSLSVVKQIDTYSRFTSLWCVIFFEILGDWKRYANENKIMTTNLTSSIIFHFKPTSINLKN